MPLSTSKIRVLVNAGADGYSRITEVEAYQAAAGSNIEWIVADQLGTPRMVVDQTGTLAGVKRHDYLPFGEELQAGVGGRTTNQGYSVSDNVRQKFAGSERDRETGLDFMQARSFSSMQGRFTSPDPFSFQKEMLADPQRFNLYAYVRNNPLFYVDPTGMIIDTSRLSKDDLEKWKKVLAVINAKDDKGNYINPKLREEYERLDSDKRTFFIENHDFGDSSTVGGFNITKHNGKDDFSEAVLRLDFEKVEHLEGTTDADLVPGFKKFEGLIGETPELRAELFGHEGAHGIYALNNVADAVRLQILKDERDANLKKLKYPYPPDIVKKMEEVGRRLIPTERFAQQSEQVINGELRSYLKRKK